jgi:hypothetical protein
LAAGAGLCLLASSCSEPASPAGAQAPTVSASPGVQPSPGVQTTPIPGRASLKAYDELLAEELGVSVTELNNASATANQRYFDQLQSQGLISSEEADFLKGLVPDELAAGLLSVFEPEPLREAFIKRTAQALNMDEATLERELREGKSLLEIAESQSVSRDSLRGRLNEAVDDVFAWLENAGIISANTADSLQDKINDLLDSLKKESPTATPTR